MILVWKKQCLAFDNYYHTIWVPEKFELREGYFRRFVLIAMKVKYGGYTTVLEAQAYKMKEVINNWMLFNNP